QTLDGQLGNRLPGAVRFVSGSATNASNQEALEHALSPSSRRISFSATMHSNTAIDVAAQRFLESAGIDGQITAHLTESSGYGPDATRAAAHSKRIDLTFPLYISQLRSDVSRDAATHRGPGRAGIPTLRPLSLDDAIIPTDQIPLTNPAS